MDRHFAIVSNIALVFCVSVCYSQITPQTVETLQQAIVSNIHDKFELNDLYTADGLNRFIDCYTTETNSEEDKTTELRITEACSFNGSISTCRQAINESVRLLLLILPLLSCQQRVPVTSCFVYNCQVEH